MSGMSFIIKRLSDGMYIYSADTAVHEKVFGRRFSSEKQAKAFMRTAAFDSEGYSICELTDEETAKLEQELKYLTGKDESHL